MGYDDRSGGNDRWRGRDDDDRGFFERAGEEVRSWFGSDDEAERGRRDDRDRRHERDRSERIRRSEDRPGWRGEAAFGGGFGNQTPERRPQRAGIGDRDGGRQDDRMPERYGGASEEGYGSRSMADRGFGPEGYGGPGLDQQFAGPRFDRADVGSVGSHGVHPVASASGRASTGYGSMGGMGGRGSTARSRAAIREAQQQGSRGHDPHYSEWRRRQIETLDRDYEDYCRENQSRFEREFGAWREERGRQRSTLSRVREQMKVIGSDGSPVGTVDKVCEDRIVLAKGDPAAGGMHHSIPCAWIDGVEDEVKLNRTAELAMREWRVEEERGAMFRTPGEHEGSGAHNLDRSFSGTH